jgi:hypothetical protein
MAAKDIQIDGSHYHELGLQPWTAMEAWGTAEELRGYHKFTALAYLAREHLKGGNADIRKAHHHLTRLVEILDEIEAEEEVSL